MSWGHGFSGIASVLAEEYNIDGTLKGSVFSLGNVTSNKRTVNNEVKTRISRMYENAGASLGSFTVRSPETLELVGNAFFKEIWELTMVGTATDNDGSAVTDEPVTAVHDKAVFIGFPGAVLDALTNDTGVTTYVEGTDYTYDQQTSLVTALSTGSITDGQALLADLTKPATGYRVDGGVGKSRSFRLIIKGKNQETKRDYVRIIHKFTPVPSGDFDEFSSDYQTWTFTGTMEVPVGMASPDTLYYTD